MRGRGYRLQAALDLLDASAVDAALSQEIRPLLGGLVVHPELDSTNRYLRTALDDDMACGFACLAERQTGGRGRRGRTWVSPFAANLYMSVYWRFSGSAAGLAGLSLAIGVAVARALAALGVEDLGLKWPKRSGLATAQVGGHLDRVGGRGDRPVRCCGRCRHQCRHAGGERCARGAAVDRFAQCAGARLPDSQSAGGDGAGINSRGSCRDERCGLEAFIPEWRVRDVAAGCDVELHLPQRRIAGTALGVDASGALLVRSGDDTLRFASGEVSLRLPT